AAAASWRSPSHPSARGTRDENGRATNTPGRPGDTGRAPHRGGRPTIAARVPAGWRSGYGSWISCVLQGSHCISGRFADFAHFAQADRAYMPSNGRLPRRQAFERITKCRVPRKVSDTALATMASPTARAADGPVSDSRRVSDTARNRAAVSSRIRSRHQQTAVARRDGLAAAQRHGDVHFLVQDLQRARHAGLAVGAQTVEERAAYHGAPSPQRHRLQDILPRPYPAIHPYLDTRTHRVRDGRQGADG